MFAGAVSLLQSFKGGANGFPESMVMRDMGSPFYSKWALIQWTHPSLLRATKCKVCQYAGRQWHLYSMLQESSAWYSYSDIQKRMWTYAVTCCVDCIRLLVGRGMIRGHSNAAPYSVHQTLGVAAVVLLETGENIWCWPCSLEYIFGLVTQHLRGHQFYSKMNAGI